MAKRYASRVDRYILWNEPNISIWLSPQARCRRGRCTPVSPHLYRALVRAAYPAIADHDPVAEIVIGALSPRGQRLRNAKTVMRPLLFLRRLGCRTDGWQRMTTAECRGFKPATGDGFAIHPYSGRTAPERRHPNADDVGLSQIRNLSATLDRLKRAKAIRSSSARLPIFIDEYGYQTNPPDRITGIKPQTQDAWLQRAAYLAWRTPRIKLFTQYLWRDEPRSANGTLSGWQSGLRFTGGRAKPSLAHFDTPFALDAANRRLWGQVRPGGAHTVTVERRPKGGAWATLAVTQDEREGLLGAAPPARAGQLVPLPGRRHGECDTAPVRRVAIIASASGNGKTTLGRALAEKLGVPFVELDALVHGPNWQETSDEDLRRQIEPVLRQEGWVIDGTYLRKLGTIVLDSADTVVWLDLPTRVWFLRLLRRTGRRLTGRERLWNDNKESLKSAFWGRESLFGYALTQQPIRRREWPRELARYPVVRLRSQAEIERWLAQR